jgi:hypothetical protein
MRLICVQHRYIHGNLDCTAANRHAHGLLSSVQYDHFGLILILQQFWVAMECTTLRGSFSGKVIGGTIIHNGDNTASRTRLFAIKPRVYSGSKRRRDPGPLECINPAICPVLQLRRY